jgi:DNA-binding transcriptional LysR family regulator
VAFLLAESIQAADLEAEALGVESLVVVAHPDHPLASRPVVYTRDMEGETLLLSRVDCSYRRSFQWILDQEKVRPATLLEFNSVSAIKQCVMEGIGITIVPEVSVAQDISQGRLAALKWEEGGLEVAVLMIWYKEKWLSPTLTAFMEMTREALRHERV